MKIIIIGGDFGDTPKQSSIVGKIASHFDERIFGSVELVNGGSITDLKSLDLLQYDLILWLANVSNGEEKYYPRKKIGATLVCSKLLHDDVTDVYAVSRIFRMNANAVIAIDTNERPFNFKLMDALGNVHCNTIDIEKLVDKIYLFARSSIMNKRIGTIQISTEPIDLEKCDNIYEVKNFIELNKLVANKSESMGGRYFGNCSTRCSKMFPSLRLSNDSILVSKRNINKERITPLDLVLVSTCVNTDRVLYSGMDKPSVDTPIQLALYKKFPEINYMIHGHYYIYDAEFTTNHYPCGDIREVNELTKIISKNKHYDMGVINLVNHGFLMYASTLGELNQLIEKSIYIKRKIGKEQITK